MTEEALDEILTTFEDGTYPRVAWHHGAHLAVAGCYLTMHAPEEALRRMRAGVIHYNDSVGITNNEDCGYHETLTRFWMAVAGRYLAGREGSRAEKVTALVDEFGERRDLFKEYWSFDVVKSREARKDWVAPDVKQL